MRPRALLAMLKQAFADWQEDGAPRLGAALSYYTIFSLAPLLVVTVAIAGLVFGHEAAQGRIVEQIGGLVGPVAGEAIETMLANARKPKEGLIATMLGIVTLLLGASGVFNELKGALNTVWEAPPRPKRGIAGMLRDRLASFAMVLVVGFLLLVSLVVSAALAALTKTFQGVLTNAALLQALDLAVSLVVVTLLFAAMYKLLPDVDPKPAWRDVWVGAILTATLFTVGKFAIGLYLGRGTIASAYGAAGSLAILLVWVYYAAQILFFGAELTQVYAQQRGSRAVAAGRPDGTALAVPHATVGARRPAAAGAEVRMSHVVETGQPSVGRLLKELTAETAELVRKEIALARTEVSEKLAHLGRNAAGVGVGAAVLLLAGLALLLAVIAGVCVLLSQFLPLAVAVWLGPLMVAAALGGYGWMKLRSGLEAIKGEGLAPRETVETLREAKAWIGAKAS